MTTNEKQLLLKDLCARLPYGVIAYASEINKNGTITDVNIPYNMVNLTVDNASAKYELVPLFDIKPYLRPMDSMTYEEKQYIRNRWCWEWEEGESIAELFNHYQIDFSDIESFVDWLNKKMFDYCELIEKGLALEATEGMYKTE